MTSVFLPSLDDSMRRRERTLLFGTAVLFTMAPLIFGTLAARKGIILDFTSVMNVILLVLAVHSFAAILFRTSSSNAAVFLIASLMEITAVLASWSETLFSPALFLLLGLVLLSAFFFGRRGGLMATLGAAAIVGLLRGFEPTAALASSLSLLALAVIASAFGATIEEGLEAEKKLRAARESAFRSERAVALSVLSAGFAHEVKNPVSGLLALLANWKTEAADTPTKEKISTLETELHRTLELVRRADAWQSRREEAPAVLDLGAIAEETVSLLAPQLEETGIRLTGARTRALARASDSEIRQTVLNLLLNAISFAGRGGEIRLETSHSGSESYLTVEDGGPGVPAANREKIFEPFLTTRPEGTGMGLAVAKNAVEAAGGKISVGESSLGGARFEIRIPAVS